MASTALIIGLILVFIGIVMLIIGIVMYSQNNNCNKSGQLTTDPNPPTTCWWVWFLIIGGIIFLILGIIMMIWGWSEGPPPPPQAMYVAGPPPRPPQPLPPQVIHHVYDPPQQAVQYVQAPPQQAVQYEQVPQPPPHPHGPGSMDVTKKVAEQRQIYQQVATTPIYQTTHTNKVLHQGDTSVTPTVTTGITTSTPMPQQVVVQRPTTQPQVITIQPRL